MDDFAAFTSLFSPEPTDAASAEAMIAALRQQQSQRDAARTGLEASLGRQQGQAGGLRTMSLLSSLGANPLLDNVQRQAGAQGSQLEGLAARTEQRLGQLNAQPGIDPLAVVRLQQAATRLRNDTSRQEAGVTGAAERLDLARQRLQLQRDKQEAGAAGATIKAEKKAAEDLRKVESQLRREVLQSDSGKQYLEARTAFLGIQSFVQNPSPATDMALVFGAMKSLDPTSVVKEGEQVQVRNTTNLPGQVLNYFEKAKSGQSFTQAQREELLHMAQLGLAARAKNLKDLSDAYAPIAASAGANMKNIMPLDLNLEEPPAPARAPAVPPPKPAAPPPNPRDFARTFEGADGRKFGQLKNGSVVLIRPDGTLEPVTVKGK